MERIAGPTEKTRKQIVKELILEAAMSGGMLHEQVMIGDKPLPSDISLEAARTILREMLDMGEVGLNPDYTLRLPKTSWD